MKKNHLILSAFIVAMIISISACNKNDDASNGQTSSHLLKTSMIENKNWSISAVELNPPFEGVFDWYSLRMEPCEKDNLITFRSDGVMILNEGITKCDSTDAQLNKDRAWMYNDDESIILVEESKGEIDELQIHYFSNTSLQLITQDEEWEDGIPREMTITFIAQ